MQRIEMLRRAGEVRRMHTHFTAQSYTIADHTYNAMCIALELCRNMLMKPDGILLTLLVHDAPEVELGDIPAPVKRSIPEMMPAYKKAEQEFMDRWGLNDLHVAHLRDQKIPAPGLSDMAMDLVKAADALELAWFVLRCRQRGDYSESIRAVFLNAISYAKERDYITGVLDMRYYLETQWRMTERKS
jgi:5'-deoxynucleotidase YfbR-like HD superfamily hydrolase